MSLSTKRYQRIFWVVLDGMGYEHVRRLVAARGDAGRFPALTRIAREGYLAPSSPASPVCQTPPALLALFSGTEPAENGIWGYYMPDPRRREGSVSGFSAQPRAGELIWEELEAQGAGFSLMNVIFRNDPLWARRSSCLDLGYDGYRLWNRPAAFSIGSGNEEHWYRGVAFRTVPAKGELRVCKGSEVKARLHPGQGAPLSLTRNARAYAQLLDGSLLVLNPLNAAMVRGRIADFRAGSGDGLNEFLDANVFRAARTLNAGRTPAGRIPLSAEMHLSVMSMKQKADLMIAAARNPHSRLVVGYFPLIDEYNHAYMDLLESEWPDPASPGTPGRATEVFLECAALVDDLLDRLMAISDPDTLLVVSSDHGAMSHRSILHVNELFAAAGLVRRTPAGSSGKGYDLWRSTAYYHPSDCGQVVVNESEAKRRGLGRQDLLRRAREIADQAGIGMVEGRPEAPYLAFFFPLGDRYFTGRPPGRGRPALDAAKAGGHHLSPLSPTPWIQAVLGLWSCSSAIEDFSSAPVANHDLKSYLLDRMRF